MVYKSYDVDTLYSWFGAFWRMFIIIIMKHYLFITIIIAETRQNLQVYCITQFQDIVYIITN